MSSTHNRSQHAVAVPLLVLLLVALCACPANALFFTLNARETYCFSVYLEKDRELVVNYVVSGFNEDAFRCWVYHASNPSDKSTWKTLKDFQKLRENKFGFQALTTGDYSICFASTDRSTKVVSFYFDPVDDKSPLLKQESVDESYDDAVEVLAHLRTVYENQQQVSVRQSVHEKLFDQTEKKVKWCAVLKMILMLLIVGIQIYVITNHFKGTPTYEKV